MKPRTAVGITLSAFCWLGACGSEGGNSASSQPQSPQPPQPVSTTVVKIMPLGDSITASVTGQHSYRFYLWHLALDKGYRIDFVGSQHGVSDGPPASTDFDMDHEGHAGWRADQVLTQIQGWASAAAPDIVLLHIGTNDLCEEQSIASTVSDVGAIIDVLRTVNPKVEILLAQLIASAGDCQISLFNAQLPALGSSKTHAESPIVLVDQYTGFDPATMTWDGLHPNAQGETQMADRWFAKLAPLLDVFGTGH
jgi:lysophospholipase L1-like esterase